MKNIKYKFLFWVKYIATFITSVVFIILLLNIFYIVSMEENNNDCMVNYIKNDYPKWYTYIIWQQHHIEWFNSSLMQYQVGTTNWCIIQDDTLYSSFANTIYCFQTKALIDLWLDKYIFYKYSKELTAFKNNF